MEQFHYQPRATEWNRWPMVNEPRHLLVETRNVTGPLQLPYTWYNDYGDYNASFKEF